MPIVFYAWQSDRPNRVNRTFIRRALDGAVKAVSADGMEVEDAVRVDQDTEGVPGAPMIADTILEKIDACGVFVPDVTFITGGDGRMCPNPNVMIEYGYALKSLGAERILAVMNSAFGSPEDLPFDMRHRRFPISYSLAPDSDTNERAAAKERLVADLQ